MKKQSPSKQKKLKKSGPDIGKTFVISMLIVGICLQLNFYYVMRQDHLKNFENGIDNDAQIMITTEEKHSSLEKSFKHDNLSSKEILEQKIPFSSEETIAVTQNNKSSEGTTVQELSENEAKKQIEAHTLNETEIEAKTIQNKLQQKNFTRYENVVIVSKVHWGEDLIRLRKMFCFCNAAYNRHVHYDIIIFTTLPWREQQIEILREEVAPSNLQVIVDTPPLEEHIASMTPEEKEYLYSRCDKKPGENITWFHHCKEQNGQVNNLAYAWQSVFRAYHIYNHPALLKYKYMIWFDSDVNCIDPWSTDPMKVMIENDLVILFYNFPYGKSRGPLLREWAKEVYDREVCGVTYKKHLKARDCNPKKDKAQILQVHGFHHITNLDFYRESKQQKLLKLMTSVYPFSRMWDDQIGVTLPAALAAPERAWSYQDHGLNFTVLHKEKIVIGRAGKVKTAFLFDVKTYWYHKGGRERLGGEVCDRFVPYPKGELP